MTQPAVSQAVAFLESGLGVALIDRSPSGATPTEFGDALLRRALQAMDLLSEGVREVAVMADPAGGEITVGASESYIAGGVLARTLQALTERFPRMRIHIAESNTAAMDFSDLRERRVDVMLGRAAMTEPPDDVQATVLLHEALVVVAGGHNAWARDPALTLTELAGKPWVLAPAGSAVHDLVAEAFRRDGVAMPDVAVTTYSMMLRLQLLSAGEYVTAFPESLVRNNAQRWDLRVLPMRLERPLPVAAFILASRSGSRTLQSFIAAAQKASLVA
jgi:DNA-binding transcriptional LysR family regulator